MKLLEATKGRRSVRKFNKGITAMPADEEIEVSESAFHNAQTIIILFGPKNLYLFRRPISLWGTVTGNILSHLPCSERKNTIVHKKLLPWAAGWLSGKERVTI